MSFQRITERVASPFAGARVNREAGTIEGVLICGFNSANGNDYPPETFRRDYHVYEGRPVNCDHSREATVERRFGWFTSVKPDANGKPRGTLNCLKSHPMYERVMEAAERNPALFGFSHVAHCKTRRGKDGRQVVEAIERIESIDLVAEPATTRGLFEGNSVRKISLQEMGLATDTPDMDTPDTGTPTDTAGEGDLKTALLNALTPLLDDAFETGDPSKAVAALKDFIKLHAKHGAKNGSAPDTIDDDGSADDLDADADDADDADADTESRKRRAVNILEALDACAAARVALRREDLELVAAAPANRRAVLIERLKNAGAYGPTSVGRSRIHPSLTARSGGYRLAEGKPPTDGKAFAEFVG